MKSKLILCSMVLGCSVGLMAQQSDAPGSTPPTFPQDQQSAQPSGQMGTRSSSPTADTQGQMGQDTSKSADKKKVEGCLSGTDGNFTLTDKSGVTYQLQGENSELAKHVGQEVKISGMASASGSSASDSSAASSSAGSQSSNAAGGNALTVSSIKKVSDSCSAGSGSAAPKQ